MSHRKILAAMMEERRGEMVKYAGAVSGDDANAEDLVQEAWLRCEQTARTQMVAKPAHLLWRILRNLSIDRGRKLGRERRMLVADRNDALWENLSDDQPCVEAMLIARAELAAIQRVLDRLDHRTRQAFEMHRVEGAKLREIADRLGISISTAHGLVGTAMHLVREAIRQQS